MVVDLTFELDESDSFSGSSQTIPPRHGEDSDDEGDGVGRGDLGTLPTPSLSPSAAEDDANIARALASFYLRG